MPRRPRRSAPEADPPEEHAQRTDSTQPEPTAAEIEDQLEEMQRVNPDDHCSSK